MQRFSFIFICAIACLLPTGCKSKISLDETLPIDRTSLGVEKIIESTSSEQKVKIDLTDVTEPVNVYIFLGKDEQKAHQDIDKLAKSSTAWLANQMKTKDTTVEVTIPAKEELHIMIQAETKNSSVRLKVKSI